MAEQSVAEVEYREVVGFPHYRIGSDGTLWRKWRHGLSRVIGGINDGYVRACLYSSDGLTYKSRFIHRLVLEAFVGPCPEGMQACHFPDATRTNNSLANLRWGTHEDNQNDMIAHGRVTGQNPAAAKLTDAMAVEIRSGYESGLTQSHLASRFGVTKTMISRIVHGKSWKRAGGPIAPNQPIGYRGK